MSLTLIIIAAAAVLGLMLFVGLFLAICFRRVVPTNMVHIVQRSAATVAYGRGKDTGNTYYAWPSWVPKFGITVTEFPESIFQVSLQDYEAYDQARLPFVVDVTAFFRIDRAEMAAQRVASFRELQQDLQAVLQGAVRRILATNRLEEIMQSRSDLGDQFTAEVKEQISEWGVSPVKTIEFMDLRDSSKGVVIANIMAKEQSRIDMESRIKVAETQQAAKLAEIDANRTVDVRRQDAEQQVGIRTAEKDQIVGIANEKTKQEIMTAARDTAERQLAVQSVEEVKKAEIIKDVALVKVEQDKKVTVVNAEAARDALVVQSQADKQSMEIRAEGELAAALKDAQGIQARGEANAFAEKAMLMAPIDTQITLAKEIGENEGYQKYLITIEQVRSGKDVGIELAKAMQGADLKVIANAGDVQQGVSKLGDLFTPAGGTNLTGMLAALAQTPEGKSLLGGLTARIGGAAIAE